MFGYDLKPIADGRTLQIATPEKSLLDLLYIYPFYNSEHEMEELRLDEDFLQENLDRKLLDEYTFNFKNKALESRVQILKNTYNL